MLLDIYARTRPIRGRNSTLGLTCTNENPSNALGSKSCHVPPSSGEAVPNGAQETAPDP